MATKDEGVARSTAMAIAGQHLRGEKIAEADRENFSSILAMLSEVPLRVSCRLHDGHVLMWPTEDESQGGAFRFTADGSSLLCVKCDSDKNVTIEEIREV